MNEASTIAARINECQANIKSLEAAALEAAVSGTASATISANGGSKSYSRLSPAAITSLIGYWTNKLREIRKRLSCNPTGIRTVIVTRG